jgi:hypothetical protein
MAGLDPGRPRADVIRDRRDAMAAPAIAGWE